MCSRFLLSILIVASCCRVAAQPAQDSFAFKRQKWAKARFEVDGAPLSELQIKWKSPKKSRYTFNEGVGDGVRKLFAGWLGNSSSSQEITLFLPGEIKASGNYPNWKAELVCPGEMEKTSTRVRNRDGSKSVETDKTVRVFWEQGAVGHLIEKDDSIGRFAITVHPLSDSSLTDEQRDFLQQVKPVSESKSFWTTTIPMDRSYVLRGQFRGQPLTICFHGALYRGAIYLNDSLLATFQSGWDDSNLLFSKKQQHQQYLLMQKGQDAGLQADALRLAALTRFVQSSVNKNFWDWD